MHPQLLSMYANAQAEALRDAAATRRRGRTATRARTGFSVPLRRPRRGRARVAV